MSGELILSTPHAQNTHTHKKNTFKILLNNTNTILRTNFLSLPLDQICFQAQILTSLLTYGAQGFRIALSKAPIRACASLPEDVSTAGFRNVALL